MNKIHLIIGLALALLVPKAFAGLYNSSHTALVEVGDNAYTVYKALGQPNYVTYVRQNPGSNGNEEIDYYTIDGQDHSLHMVDGKVYSIDGDENID